MSTNVPSQEPMERDDVALVVVDLQEGPLRSVGSMPTGDLVANTAALVRVARLLEMPVVFATAAIDGPLGALSPTVLGAAPDARVVWHATNDVWRTDDFVEAISATGRKTLAFAGIATDVGVGLAALGAVRRGMRAYVIADASGTVDERAERAAWLRLSASGVALTSWSGFAGEVVGSYMEGLGPAVRAVVAARLGAAGGVFHDEVRR